MPPRKNTSPKNADLEFEFRFRFNDPDFSSFTEGPVNQICYYSYRGNDKTESDEGVYEPTISHRSPKVIDFNGSICVFIKQLLSAIFELNQPTFLADLKARKTALKYWIVNSSDLKIAEPVVTSDNEFYFEGPSLEKMPNQQEAMVFSSWKEKFPVLEVPTHRFALRNKVGTLNGRKASNGKSKPYPLIVELPTPSPKNFSFESDSSSRDDPKPISEVYVYL